MYNMYMNNNTFNIIVLLYWSHLQFCICCDFNETHALILARGGSKGIENKNLIRLNGLSLLARTIQTIQATGLFNNIWVSTDFDRIEKEAVKYGALVFKRSSQFAQDNSSSLDAVKEFLSRNSFIHNFALFQCTSVFLRAAYIQEALEKFQHGLCVFAVTKSQKLRWSLNESGKLRPLNFNIRKRPRRQDWSGEFVETGMFYFGSRSLVQRNLLQTEWCDMVIVDPKDSIEIDTWDDVQVAECLLMHN